MMQTQTDIEMLEKYLGFPIKKKEITLKSNEPYNEVLSYGLCQRFYNKDDELKLAIKKTTTILMKILNNKDTDEKYISIFFSLLGNMYYVLGDYKQSIGCFMKSLSYNKNDTTDWIELIFALRAYGEFEIFEDIIFNFEKIYNEWKNNPSKELTKEKVYELINKIKI
jgi:tetratricopeptide (TPR) repeat protein|tara:strand:- start:221 stop:721 length:501 start_codon:yes stop_codon:yes gene_type:complete